MPVAIATPCNSLRCSLVGIYIIEAPTLKPHRLEAFGFRLGNWSARKTVLALLEIRRAGWGLLRI